MKKSILLITFLIFSISYASAQTQPKELIGAKQVLTACYHNLHDHSNRIGSVLLHKKFSKTQTVFIILAKSDIDLAAQVAIGTTRMYTLQSVQISIPDKAKKILRDNCYDAINTLNPIQDRLSVIMEEVNDRDVKIIILSSIDFIKKSKQAIQIILRFQKKGFF